MSLLVAAVGAFGLQHVQDLCRPKPGETLTQGYVIDQQSIDLVPVGSSREQVLLALGSPSTTATFDNEVFYYISQTRRRPVAFMNAKLVDQRILAVYFNEEGRVDNIANYGLQGRQGVRLHLAHHADRRQGPELPRPDAFRRRQDRPERRRKAIMGGGN